MKKIENNIEYTYCQVTISNINQGKIWIQDNSP